MGIARRIGILLLCLAVACPPAMASPDGAAMHFELPLLDGSRFVRLDEIASPRVLLNFWGSECAPCVREMPLLDQWAAGQAAVSVLGIAVDAPDQAQRFVVRHPVRYRQLRAGVDPLVLLRRFGNRSGVLPYTVLLGAQRQPCASRRGELDAAWLAAALQACR